MIQRSDKQKDKGHTVQNDDESIQCVLLRLCAIILYIFLHSTYICKWLFLDLSEGKHSAVPVRWM